MKYFSLKSLLAIGSLLTIILSVTAFIQVKRTGSIIPIASNQRGSMYFEGSRQAGIQQPYKLKVYIDTQNQVANTVGLKLHFDAEKIQVNDISTTESFCQFYPEKKFDNRLGQISLSCGSPPPGVKGKNQIIEITFLPLQVGTTVIRMADTSSLLLNDGKGTNILKDFPYWEVQVGTNL